MNKKLLNLILITTVLVFPGIAFAVEVPFIENIKGAFITVGIAVVVIGWVIAGILYLTAAGSPEKVGTAKKALFACLIGTALIALAAGMLATIKLLLGVTS